MKKHGGGRYNYENGDFYDGRWQNNKRHGNGRLIRKSWVIEGVFDKDEVVTGKLSDPQGNHFYSADDPERKQRSGFFLHGKL